MKTKKDGKRSNGDKSRHRQGKRDNKQAEEMQREAKIRKESIKKMQRDEIFIVKKGSKERERDRE
jgi:hypothetical protein